MVIVMNPEFYVRDMNEDDHRYVFSTWYKQAYDSIPYRFMLPEDFKNNHSKLIKRHMNRGQNLVACDVDDPSVIFGYVVSEELEECVCIDFLFVKATFRGLGMARKLLKECAVEDKHFIMTHLPKKGSKLERLGPYIVHELYRF